MPSAKGSMCRWQQHQQQCSHLELMAVGFSGLLSRWSQTLIAGSRVQAVVAQLAAAGVDPAMLQGLTMQPAALMSDPSGSYTSNSVAIGSGMFSYPFACNPRAGCPSVSHC